MVHPKILKLDMSTGSLEGINITLVWLPPTVKNNVRQLEEPRDGARGAKSKRMFCSSFHSKAVDIDNYPGIRIELMKHYE